jgi:hypothetical protein
MMMVPWPTHAEPSAPAPAPVPASVPAPAPAPAPTSSLDERDEASWATASHEQLIEALKRMVAQRDDEREERDLLQKRNAVLEELRRTVAKSCEEAVAGTVAPTRKQEKRTFIDMFKSSLLLTATYQTRSIGDEVYSESSGYRVVVTMKQGATIDNNGSPCSVDFPTTLKLVRAIGGQIDNSTLAFVLELQIFSNETWQACTPLTFGGTLENCIFRPDESSSVKARNPHSVTSLVGGGVAAYNSYPAIFSFRIGKGCVGVRAGGKDAKFRFTARLDVDPTVWARAWERDGSTVPPIPFVASHPFKLASNRKGRAAALAAAEAGLVKVKQKRRNRQEIETAGGVFVVAKKAGAPSQKKKADAPKRALEAEEDAAPAAKATRVSAKKVRAVTTARLAETAREKELAEAHSAPPAPAAY